MGLNWLLLPAVLFRATGLFFSRPAPAVAGGDGDGIASPALLVGGFPAAPPEDRDKAANAICVVQVCRCESSSCATSKGTPKYAVYTLC